MALDPTLLEVLACPEDHGPLYYLEDEQALYNPRLHRRYEIAGIPTTVVIDGDGVVRAAFVGAFTATDLWAAVAEARAPGSTPEPELGELT